jgi:hypothetical protein
MTVILGPDFARKRGLPFAKLSDVQPHAPDTRAPIGCTPWRAVEDDKGSAVLKDRDGNTLCTIVTRQIAALIASAVNMHAPLLAERGVLEDILRATQAELAIGTAEDAVKRARELLDKALTP